MGEGASVCFWVDDWVGVGPLRLLLPTLFKVVSSKVAAINKCFVWKGNVVSWYISIRGALSSFGVGSESLSSLLSNVLLCWDAVNLCMS